MRTIDASTIMSRSQSESINDRRSLSMTSGKFDFFDVVFPFFDELYKMISISNLFIGLSKTLLILQSVFQVSWLLGPEYHLKSKEKMNIMHFMIKFLLFLDPLDYKNMINSGFIVLSAVFASSLLYLLIIGYYFSVNRNYKKWMLYFPKVMFDCVFPLLLIPTSTYIGQGFTKAFFNTGQDSDLIYFGISIVYLCYFFGLYVVNWLFMSSSPFISKSIYATFEPWTMIKFITLITFTQLLSFFVVLFPSWSLSLMNFIHMLVSISILVSLHTLPFLSQNINTLFCSCFIIIISSDICVMIYRQVFMFPEVIFMIAPLGLGIISLFIFKPLMKSISDKASTALENSVFEGKDVTYDQKKEYFISIGLDCDIDKLMLFLRVGLQTGSDFILDGSLVRFSFEYFSSTDILAFCVLLLCFIPGHLRFLNSLFVKLVKRRDLMYHQRFLVYEVYRIKTIRQSSVSLEFNERISMLKQKTKNCLDILKSFWIDTPDSIASLYLLHQNISSIKVQWIEAIEDFPNASKGYEEYSTFLVECASDFVHSVVQIKKISLIDKGYNFYKDYSYRSFVSKFPFYLKDKILDLKGNFLSKQSHRGSQNSSGHSSSSFGEEMIEMLAEEEEAFAKEIMNHHRMRLAFQRAIEDRHSQWSGVFKNISLFIMVFSIGVTLGIFIYMWDYFTPRVSSVSNLYFSNQARFFSSISRIAMLLRLGNHSYDMKFSDSQNLLVQSESSISPPLDVQKPYNPQVITYTNKGRIFLNDFIIGLVESAFQGKNVYKLASIFLKNEQNMSICYGSSTLNNSVPISVKSLYTYSSLGLMRMTTDNPSSWQSSSLFCNIMSNNEMVIDRFNYFASSMIKAQKTLTDTNDESFTSLSLIVPISSWILIAFLSFVSLGLFSKDLKKVLHIIRDIPENMKHDVINPIRKGLQCDDQTSSNSNKNSQVIVYIFIILFIVTTVPPFLFYYIFLKSKDENIMFEIFSNWMIIGGSRESYLAESLEYFTISLMLKYGFSFPPIQIDHSLDLSDKYAIMVDQFHKQLMAGSGRISPCVDYDSILDSLHFTGPCKTNMTSTDTHEGYRCSSLSQSIILFRTYSSEAITKFNEINNFSHPLFFNLFHLVNSHLFSTLLDVSSRVNQLSIDSQSDFQTILILMLIISVGMSVLILILSLRLSAIFDSAYDAALVLIRRVPPVFILNEDSLMSFVMNKKNREKKQDLSFAQQVIYNSGDAIFFLSKNSIVEMINPGVSRLLGYVPEQLLGQSISTIVNEESKNQLLQQINMIRNRQTSEVFEDHIVCLSDSNNQIQCHLTILGIKSESSHDISSFVVFLRDESELLNQQKNAETAKQKSEELLFQILPRDIVLRLNQGERDITFTVPSASVMFIDIVRFSDYSVNLTPQQIMGNLSLIFDSFDRFLSKYPLITKIKLIGDIYMCASGLFAPESASQTHSEQIIRFGLDCLYELEEINVRLNSNLSVRIGVNSGGPIIGGVLGFDKPVFDIIGDTINVASRLTSTCIPGKIQIPQTTYDLISQLDFSIEKRGEVFLKGKGKTMTYLVNQTGNSLFISGHSSTLELIQQQMKRD